ncbi:ABC-F family ATP-binding cassette domain-containing protein [Marinococcus halophilus]|uniref:ABC-F family ATP-binding cassette domain-containing protein n=1 Tax=Marinococcus halophilus TaxID=1371 RepID=UPI0009A828F6|nr:ABC-F family ATP-binding cassette domain-containing protein [Marinococcus halophilus]
MILLQCSAVTKSFGAETVLDQIKLEVKEGERVALVGNNGAGKSTLLKILAGESSYDSGSVTMPKGTTFGYLEQHTGLNSDKTMWDEMLDVFTHLQKAEAELRRMEARMAEPDIIDDARAYEKLMADYDQRQQEFEARGGYRYESDIRTVLAGLGFGSFSLDTPVQSLSGGQKTRLALGKLLLSRPDLLILDEPTNHLDMDTLRWLEQYLSSYPGAVLIVSHDRYFLDQIVTKVYEIIHKKARLFYGNYSAFQEKRAELFEQEMQAYEKQQKEIAELEDFVQKNIVRASTTKRAQSRRKKLEKMDKLDKPQRDGKSASLRFDIDRQSGNDVLKAEDLTFRFGDKAPVFEHLNVRAQRGESIALIGPNGTGKSTFLKTIKGELEPDAGHIQLGSKVDLGYYDQQQAELNSGKTVLQELWDEYPLENEKDIRTVLGQFLFTGEDVLKQVSDLSGGEKARLSLAKMMMQKSNFLLLDEPTNHLDLDSKEVLEDALIDYPGTILFVSHDRYFLNRIATRILEMGNGDVRNYIGDYDYYLFKKEEEREKAALQAEREGPKPEDTGAAKSSFADDKAAKREARKRQRRIEQIEQDIEAKEQLVEEQEAALFEPDVYEDHEKAAGYQSSINELRSELDQLMEEWEELQLEESSS